MSNRFDGPRGAWQAVSRRLGARHRVGLLVHWRRPAPPIRRRRRSVDDDRREALLHDLSVSGARLLLPADGNFVRHQIFDLEIDGNWSRVEVAWVEPSSDALALWCGVEFLAPGKAFMSSVFRHLAAGRSG
jgi:hypothetical protein